MRKWRTRKSARWEKGRYGSTEACGYRTNTQVSEQIPFTPAVHGDTDFRPSTSM